MRELKYRVWDYEKKVFLKRANKFDFYLTSDGLLHVSSGWDSYKQPVYEEETDQNRYEICFYTENNDKNGIEIYEGDVLSEPVSPVNPHGNGYLFKNKIIKWSPMGYDIFCSEASSVLVGNIYENPDLVE